MYITVQEVDSILGVDWTDDAKKPDAVLQANAWLSTKRYCKKLDDGFKQAAARVAKLASQDLLYVSRSDGIVTEKSVKADTVSVTKKYAEGRETAKSADMQLIEDMIKPYLCSGVGGINGWVCK